MRHRPIQLTVRTLEDRTVPATFIVNTTADNTTVDAFTTLREAILSANANIDADVISFNIPGTGVQTIAPTGVLPPITSTVTLDATTQPGYTGTPVIELDGTNAGVGQIGLFLQSHFDSTIRGLAINRFGGPGIVLQGGRHTLTQNFIGTDPTGMIARPNGGVGIEIGSDGNVIGGPGVAQRNLISGNLRDGIQIQGQSNIVGRNFIGVAIDGKTPLGNGRSGVLIAAGTNNIIGARVPGEAANVISGNTLDGVRMEYQASLNTVLGNTIGGDVGAMLDVGNGGDGIRLDDGGSNLIGGIAPNSTNIILGNGGYGIHLLNSSDSNEISNNYIGADLSTVTSVGNDLGGVMITSSLFNTIGGLDPAARNLIHGNGGSGVTVGISLQDGRVFGNSILGNSIDRNVGFGIDLGNDDATPLPGEYNPAAPGFAPLGPNQSQYAPILDPNAIIRDGQITITGRLVFNRNVNQRVEFFASRTDLPDGVEGETFLGFVEVLTDANGDATFSFVTDAPPAGTFITATATNLPIGNSSEFSSPAVAYDAIVFTSTSLPNGIVGSAYNSVVTAIGGNQPLIYELTNNTSLPAGLTLSPTGVITGTPTASGTTTFTIVARTANGIRTTQDYTVSIAPLPQAISFTLTGPVTFGIAPITLNATGGASGSPVVYSILSGPGTIAGNVLTITGVGTITIAANQAGNSQYRNAAQVTQTLQVGLAPSRVTGSAVGDSPLVTVLNDDGSVRFTLVPFEQTYRGGVFVAIADVSGDGVNDVICWAGLTGGPRITIYDGITGELRANFFAFDENLRTGVNVVVANLDGVGPFEILATPGQDGGPVLAYFDGMGVKREQIFIGPEADRNGVTLATNVGLDETPPSAQGSDAEAITSIGFARPFAPIDSFIRVEVSTVAGWFDGIGDPIGTLAGVFVG